MADPGRIPTLGILGGGQLGRMIALAGIRMGIQVKMLTPESSGPEIPFADSQVGDWENADVLSRFAEGCNAITVESEWAPVEALLDVIGNSIPVYPSLNTVHTIRHKGRQKRALLDAGLPVPLFRAAQTLGEAEKATAEFGYPILLKRFEGSYDGYGNTTCKTKQDLESAWSDLSSEDGALVEAWVPFQQELAVLVARRPGGARVVYPVVYSEQRDHRCHAVVVPATISRDVYEEAQRLAVSAVEAVDGIGVTAIEMFLLENGELLINELAPRPHNSGHYSIEACHVSQFENHARGVLDWPLGDPDLRVSAACMVNVLGHREDRMSLETLQKALETTDASVHVYGKTDVRPRRKMGHVTVTAATPAEARTKAESAAAALQL